MRLLNLDLLDGHSLITVAVADDVKADRICRFMRDAKDAFRRLEEIDTVTVEFDHARVVK